MPTAPLRRSNPVVAPHTSSTNGASHGEWSVDSEGRFCSFWPPSYRACYDLHWIVENGSVVGLRFTELDRGSVFVGRYQ